ncbi:MAG: AMP-binding protein [Deltaproteobacteria bacterium]|nr:AMP-binding protein [Deltaproteobacteria bacterium]
MLIHEHLQRAAEQHGDREAIVSGERCVRYGGYARAVDELARALLASGVEPGDRVGVLLPNWPEFVFASLGAMSVGAIAVMINIRLAGDEIHYQLEDSGARLLLAVSSFKGRDYREILSEIEPALPALEQVVYLEEAEPEREGWESWLARGRQVDPARLSEVRAARSADETIALLYTSGTTGRPKGVMFRHGNFVQNTHAYIEATEQRPSDRRLTVVPMYHTSGAVAFMASCFLGGTNVLLDDFSADRCIELVEAERITILGGVPTILVLMLRSPRLDDCDISTLRVFVSFGAPLQPSLVRAARSKGLEVLNVYGMTEMGVATMTRFGDPEHLLEDSVGRPIPAVEVRIVDAERRDLPAGEVGELAVRSETLMQGYWQKAEATAEVLDAQGWFYTGDLAREIGDGYLQIMGRKDDMYIRGGVNVYPKEIEDVLQAHPAVLLSAVIGVPDPVMGQVGCAFAVLRPGEQAEEGELLAYLAERVADYKLPKQVVFREQLPLNATRKVIKKQLLEEFLAAEPC